MDKLGLSLIKAFKLQRVEDVPEGFEAAEKPDPWISAGKIQKEELPQWLRNAKELFGDMPVRFTTHVPLGEDVGDIISQIKATQWIAN